jgi:hypothetical protein
MFVYNYTTRKLCGTFKATASPTEELDSWVNRHFKVGESSGSDGGDSSGVDGGVSGGGGGGEWWWW